MEVPQKASHSRSPAYLQGSDERHGADGLAGAGQALAEGVLHHLGADDGPAGAVVQQLPVGFFRARRRLWRGSQLCKCHGGDSKGPGPRTPGFCLVPASAGASAINGD